MENLVTVIVGIVLIALGISNRKGNISTLHSYHRHRVSEEDRLPFGKVMGLGTIICGVGVILMGIFTFLATWLQQSIYMTIGSILLAIGLVVGLGISFYGLFKYNKGIF